MVILILSGQALVKGAEVKLTGGLKESLTVHFGVNIMTSVNGTPGILDLAVRTV